MPCLSASSVRQCSQLIGLEEFDAIANRIRTYSKHNPTNSSALVIGTNRFKPSPP